MPPALVITDAPAETHGHHAAGHVHAAPPPRLGMSLLRAGADIRLVGAVVAAALVWAAISVL